MLVMFNPLYGLAALIVILIVLRRKGKSLAWLFFFSLFWLYLMQVVSVAVFPFPIGIPYEGFKPNLNLIPFDFGYCDPRARDLCLRQIYENILLTIPFGFGVNFIARLKPKQIWGLAAGVGLTLELVQLAITLTFRISFRVVDINDVLFNAAGVLTGYAAFRLFGWTYSQLLHRLDLQPRHIFAYIQDLTRLSTDH